MPLKFSGIDASGKHTSLTLSGKSLRILPDRILVGDNALLRNWDTWGKPDGKASFTEIVVEEEEAPASTPTPTAPSKPAPPPTRK